MSEVQFAARMLDAGLSPRHGKKGPDLRLDLEGRRIWVEVICPEPEGLPKVWSDRPVDREVKAYSVPFEAILLRWTAAIKEKAEKLLAKNNDPKSGYPQQATPLHDCTAPEGRRA